MKKLLLFLGGGVIIFSCKKNIMSDENTHPEYIVTSNSKLRNPLLEFKTKDAFKLFYSKIESSNNLNNTTPPNFKSLKQSLEDYKSSKEFSRNSSASEVDTLEYLYDLKSNLVMQDPEAEVLNEELQIIVQDTFYQVTRLGIFKVPFNKIQEFIEFYDDYEDSILFNPEFKSIPGEVALTDGSYIIEEIIYRVPKAVNLEMYDDGNLINNSSGGSGGYVPPCSIVLPQNFQYNEYTIGSNFNKKEYIHFDDRRFVFQVFNNSFLGIINSVGIRAKLQRERKFLWFYYWGESFADEIIVGVNNMDLKTDYVFPTPQQFNSLSQPQFTGFFNMKIGNHILEDVLGINLNINIPFTNNNINNTDASNFINGIFNTYVNNTFNDIFSPFVNNLIAYIDPSFPSRYENNTKRINSLMEQNKYRISISNGTKKQGYSHKNTWRFDWNIGAEIFPGPHTSNPSYRYDMKSGNFFGRARVGCKWYGIKMIKI